MLNLLLMCRNSEEEMGRAYGMFNFAIGISALPSSILMGAIWEKYGSQTAFFWGASLALISTILFTMLVRDFQYITDDTPK
jgi:dipeptide/tripeptide permease